ncbi:MAG: hypothetical protein FRX48_07158 [Lasallia pustulata]|uniref:Uncharacterized protein n=1 Tax=Lasallia pustulata TaxID=136370 RepID=A0A5M8PJ70_9LECA|nr:MAG: hypothetical protein FRX48_07158 [Lasallia pustulata]
MGTLRLGWSDVVATAAFSTAWLGNRSAFSPCIRPYIETSGGASRQQVADGENRLVEAETRVGEKTVAAGSPDRYVHRSRWGILRGA